MVFYTKISLCLILLLLIFYDKTKAQEHDKVWLFGINHGINDPLAGGCIVDFKLSPPKFFKRPANIDFGSYCAVGNDSTGRLLFYTNGISIRDTTDNIMLNGDSINFDQFWISDHDIGYPNGACAFVVPAPGLPNHYYLLHMATSVNEQLSEFVNNPFYYTLIDMNGNNGKGKVVVKNQVMMEGNLTYPVVVKHGNGRDWWVLSGEQNTALTYRMLISPTGIQGPFVQSIGPEPFYEEYTGVNAISPDGHTYVRVDQLHNLRIFDFDRCTGLLSNLRILPFTNGVWAFMAQFSPNSRRLYLNTPAMLMSVDLHATNIAATLDTLATFDGGLAPFATGFWTPGIMPDGKIYMATTNGTLKLHVINHPDWPGQTADFAQQGVDLPVYNSGTMCRFPNYRLGEWENAPCDTLNAQQVADGFYKTMYPPDHLAPTEKDFRLLPPLGGDPANGPSPSQEPAIQSLIPRCRLPHLIAPSPDNLTPATSPGHDH